jgi:hypothetical protein
LHQLRRHIALVGEIDTRLDQRTSLDNLCAPGLRAFAQKSLELPQRLTALHLGLGIDQVGEAFDLGEIKLTVLKTAPGVFARLRWTQPFDPLEFATELFGESLGPG